VRVIAPFLLLLLSSLLLLIIIIVSSFCFSLLSLSFARLTRLEVEPSVLVPNRGYVSSAEFYFSKQLTLAKLKDKAGMTLRVNTAKIRYDKRRLRLLCFFFFAFCFFHIIARGEKYFFDIHVQAVAEGERREGRESGGAPERDPGAGARAIRPDAHCGDPGRGRQVAERRRRGRGGGINRVAGAFGFDSNLSPPRSFLLFRSFFSFIVFVYSLTSS
jgi:hypothetical protein